MKDTKPWNLVADIGGTNARFAVHDITHNQLRDVLVLSVAEHSTFMNALEFLLTHIRNTGEWNIWPDAACLAVACPADREVIEFTNSSWTFTKTSLKTSLNHVPVDVINDFSAVAYSIPHLAVDEWHQIGGLTPIQEKPICILGPGTGLGACTLLPLDSGYHVLDGEGGHIDFAPTTALEVALLTDLQQRYPRVSVERVLSGNGIENIYQFLCDREKTKLEFKSAQEITEAAIQHNNEMARRALSIFCEILGSTASNLALITGAKGGVYIAGGIAPRFIEFIDQSNFRQRFEDKGRFKSYVQDIPVRIILKPHLGLFGAKHKVMSLNH